MTKRDHVTGVTYFDGDGQFGGHWLALFRLLRDFYLLPTLNTTHSYLYTYIRTYTLFKHDPTTDRISPTMLSEFMTPLTRKTNTLSLSRIQGALSECACTLQQI